MAIFRKKSKQDSEADSAGSGSVDVTEESSSSGGGTESYSPEKAARFFEHARTVHDATNYEYAMQLWLSGMSLDPTGMNALEGYFKSAAKYLGSGGGKKGPGKDMVKAISGRGALSKYLQALLAWGLKPSDAVAGIKATEYAAKLELSEQAYWLGERAIAAASRDKKPRKDLFVKLMETFESIGAFDKAVQAGEVAKNLDPADGKLGQHVRNLAAQNTMTSGGFEQSGQEGGFRRNIRNAEAQKQLIDDDKIVKTEETIDRVVAAAKADYESRPEDPAAITKYTKTLLERGRPEDEEQALQILNKAFEITKAYRFKERAGEITLRRAKRKVAEVRRAAEADPLDEAKQEAVKKIEHQFAQLELKHLLAAREAYPTDLKLAFRLGSRHFDLENYEDAIALFQEARADQRHKVGSLELLAQSFLRIEWIDEAVQTFRQAIDANANPEKEMELQYGLLTALQAKAERERDLGAATEAEQMASDIAIRQINFKDVRKRRDELKALIAELKAA